MDVPCVSVHSRCISSHKTDAYTLSFFEMRGAPSQPEVFCYISPACRDQNCTTCRLRVSQSTLHHRGSDVQASLRLLLPKPPSLGVAAFVPRTPALILPLPPLSVLLFTVSSLIQLHLPPARRPKMTTMLPLMRMIPLLMRTNNHRPKHRRAMVRHRRRNREDQIAHGNGRNSIGGRVRITPMLKLCLLFAQTLLS